MSVRLNLLWVRAADLIRRAWDSLRSNRKEKESNASNDTIFCLKLPLFYLLIALPIVTANAFILGPFQAADEFNHFFRIVQISHGALIGQNDEIHPPGGEVDASVADIAELFAGVAFRADHRVNAGSVQQLRSRFWSWPDKIYVGFVNTVVYPPYFYAPAVIAVKLSQFLGTSILDALTLARLAQGFASIVVAYLALRLARFGRLTLFILLVLPMTLSLDGSASQDGFLISCLALAFALHTTSRPSEFAKFLIAIVLGAAVAAKPPYFPLFLLFLLPWLSAHRCANPRAQILKWAPLGLFVTISWLVFGFIPNKSPYLQDHGVSSSDQIMFIAHNPDFILKLACNTIKLELENYARGFIGILGWLDTPLSTSTYRFYGILIASFIGVDILIGGNNLKPAGRMIVLWAVLLSVGAVFMALYLGWTPVGYEVVQGVQGRYFIPLAVFLPAAFTPQGALLLDRSRWTYRLAELLPLLGGYGLWVVPRALMARYWG